MKPFFRFNSLKAWALGPVLIIPLAITISCSQTTTKQIQQVLDFKDLKFSQPVASSNFYQQIDSKWIMTNQALLIDQNQFQIRYLEQISAIESALIKQQLVINFTINGSAAIGQTMPTSTNQSVLINNVPLAISQSLNQWDHRDLVPISANVVDAKASQISFKNLSNDLSQDQYLPLNNYDSITLAKQAHIFDQQWFFNNRHLLFKGTLDLITNPDNFYFPAGEQVEVEAAADGTSLKLYVGLKGLHHFQKQRVSLDPVVIPISIINLKPIDQLPISINQLPTTHRELILAIQLGWFGSVEQAISQVDQNWIFAYRHALLMGNTTLLTRVDQIENVFAERLNANSMRISFDLAPLSYLNDKQQVGQVPKRIAIIVIGFDQGLSNRPIVPNPHRPQPGQGGLDSLVPLPLPPLISAPFDLQKQVQNLNQQLVALKLISEQLSRDQYQAINQANVMQLFTKQIIVPSGYQIKLVNWIAPDAQGILKLQFAITQIQSQKTLYSEIRVFKITIKD